ncbi:MAG TPA: PEP/pyruvate-binding domain-containing protein [Kofleriaceae bacterium]|nr:PEP/pyruvate-binding domain-containing protein [Kofleriaceae bacterium]
MHDLADLRDARAGFGNKAAGLARLIAAGLPVPAGFAIAERVFEQVAGLLVLRELDLDVAGHAIDAAARRIEQAEPPAELARELRAHLRELGSTVIVRSSSSIEDGARGGGAGVFESSDAIPAELERVWHAIRAVWTSALAPAAIAYARGRTTALGLGVIVQHHVEGERITVYTRSPSGNDELVIQRGNTLVRTPRVKLPSELADQHAVIQALRAERVLGVPADVELVQVRTREEVLETWVVQARPIVIPPARPALAPPPPIVLAPLQDGRVWTWDVTHNPDPLSPAQAALVERVERAQLGAYELRVIAGYLYTSPREPERRAFTDELSAALAARCRDLEAEAEQILAPGSAHGHGTTTLERAFATYETFYALWANELSPRIAELRVRGRDDHARVAEAWPHPFRDGGSYSRPPHHRPSSVEVAIAASARGAIDFAELVRRIGAVSPTWDVAVPTFGERAELLQQAIAIARGEPASEPTSSDRAAQASDADRAASELRSENVDLAAIAADLAERDDLLFARAQQLVRTALLARGAELGIGDDIFWTDLELVRAHDPSELDPILLQRKASAARSANARASAWQMPLVVGAPSSGDEPRRETLHGVGAGPRVTGRVVRFASLASAVLASPGDVVVVRAVTPALAVFVGRCAALVSETGGLLDHGAALARELGITCVVGCRDAWTSLRDHDTVDVDGDAGTVTRH